MLDSNIRGLFKRIEYQIANLKGLFSKNEKQMLDNVNEFIKENEEFKDSQKYVLTTHIEDKDNPHNVTKTQIGLDKVNNIQQASKTEFDSHVNNSQIYKITADSGLHLLAISSGSKIFDAIKDKGSCTFYAARGAEDSPSQYALRGMQTVGQTNIGTGIAVDVVGNAFSFYYNADHTSINWTPLPNLTDQDKWNSGQLFTITNEFGSGKFHISNTDNFHEMLPNYNGFVHFTSDTSAVNGPGIALRGLWLCNRDGTQGSVIGVDNLNRTWRKNIANGEWSAWERLLTSAEKIAWKSPTALLNGWKQFGDQKVQFYKNAFGEVELIGAIEGGVIGSELPAFTLPIGYRPIQSMHYIGVASSSTLQSHKTYIDTGGNVYIQATSNAENPVGFIAFGFKFTAA